MIAEAGEGDVDRRRDALGKLLTRYLPALRAHLTAWKGLTPDRADDVLQEFVARKVLEKDLIAHADRQLGKFRTFLLTAMDRFLINVVREERGQKRSPKGRIVELDDETESRGADRRQSDVFDVAWARTVIDQGLERMRMECEMSGRADVWGVFECRVVGPMLQGTPMVGYQELVDRFGLRSPAQATNILVTGKRMYARVLRSVVAEYCRDGEEIESELAELRIVASHVGSH
jgi:DNA-directed RNA polymerase specialized sigma24 family protein